MNQNLSQKPLQAGKFVPSPLYSIQTLIGSLDQTKLAVGIDTSAWEAKLSPALVSGADFVMPKATDGYQVQKGNWGDLGSFIDKEFYNTVQTCYDVGRPCIPYHFFQWNYTDFQWTNEAAAKFQYEIICNAFKNLVPHVSYHGFAIDLETPGDTDTNYRDKVMKLYSLLKADPKFSDIPILFYSSNYYLNMWPALRDTLSYKGTDKLFWMAQWVYTQGFKGTWDEFRARVLPTINMKVITPGYANWECVQWSASCTIEGFAVDVNSWNKSKDDLYKMLNYKQGTPPPPVDNPDLTAVLQRLDQAEAEIAALKQFRDHVKNS